MISEVYLENLLSSSYYDEGTIVCTEGQIIPNPVKCKDVVRQTKNQFGQIGRVHCRQRMECRQKKELSQSVEAELCDSVFSTNVHPKICSWVDGILTKNKAPKQNVAVPKESGRHLVGE